MIPEVSPQPRASHIPPNYNARRGGRALIALLGAVAGAVALSSCGPNTSGSTNTVCRSLTQAPPQRPAGWNGSVFTIVMENHSRDAIFGNPAAPYINGLASSNAVAAAYHDSYVHPSEPNYIWMIAGENFGILNDNDPSAGQTIDSQSHLADQIERAGMTWKTYQESMGAPCGLQSHDLYAVKHSPFVYFDDINGWNGSTFQPTARCLEHVVDYSALDADLAPGTTPDYVFITPNLIDDMHDGSVQDGDTWLSQQVPKILASSAYQNGGVLFLLWDEGTSQSDDPPFIAISPNAKPGFSSPVDYDTSSFLKTVQGIMGLEPLPCAPTPDTVQVMSDLFTVPVSR